ncbi:hypothetical protein R1sor_015518 [Riccia sorocarpa]|uniref:Uncharacterized protein n=1 Tax=Riccia sorocarpa TaxID=122646 RepID=A0ABD3HIL9_9MARC
MYAVTINSLILCTIVLRSGCADIVCSYYNSVVHHQEAGSVIEIYPGPTTSAEMNRIDNPADLERMGVVQTDTDDLYDLSSNTCEEGKENAVVIFFHGLELDDRANAEDTWLRTWTYRDESNSSPMSAECWPAQMFSADGVLKKKNVNVVIRAYAAKYDANKY